MLTLSGCRTPLYCAPEILTREPYIGNEVDIVSRFSYARACVCVCVCVWK
jgi:hypothetical protein